MQNEFTSSALSCSEQKTLLSICMQSCRHFIMGNNNRCVTLGLVRCLSVDKDRHVLGLSALFLSKTDAKTRDNHEYCPGRACKAVKSVETTQEQCSKHNEFNHNFGEQALDQAECD